jgi:Glycosyl transferase family 2
MSDKGKSGEAATACRNSSRRRQKPFLSVVMPVHGGAEWIAATLDSLVVAQTDGFEIILIDSSPSEDTSRVVDTYAVKLPLRTLQRSDLKPWQTKTNLGVELAAADHVCILHQDDLWLPGRSAAIRRWIESAPEAPLHFAPTVVIDRRGRRMGRWACPLPPERALTAEFVLERLLVQNFVAVPAVVFRRDAWLACGGMDETLWYTPDWDVWAKLAAAGSAVYHDEATTAFRIHGGSQTVAGSRDASEFRSQMQIVLDRHLGRLPVTLRQRVEPAARASISINVSLATAFEGSLPALIDAGRKILALGPGGMRRYLRNSRLRERVLPRVRAKLAGAF